MIKRFGGLFLREEQPDILIVTNHYSLTDFGKKLQMNPDHILYVDKKRSQSYPLNKDSKVLITVDQGGRRSPNTLSEIYIQTANQPVLLCAFWAFEGINDLRKTECYKLAEYIAEKIKSRYGIAWEYKIGVDTPEKEKQFNKGAFWIILTLIITYVIIYYRLKYEMNHPR